MFGKKSQLILTILYGFFVVLDVFTGFLDMVTHQYGWAIFEFVLAGIMIYFTIISYKYYKDAVQRERNGLR